MNIRTFSTFLMMLAIMGGLAGALILRMHHVNPPSMSEDAQRMRIRMANGIGTMTERAKLDALYEESEQQPPAAKYLLIASGAVFLLGLGLLIASPGEKEAARQAAATQPVPSPTVSIAQGLQTLAGLKAAGQITQSEFDLAKEKLLLEVRADTKTPSA